MIRNYLIRCGVFKLKIPLCSLLRKGREKNQD